MRLGRAEARRERASPRTPSAAYCDGRIARFKVPKYVKFVESFPMTVTGKVQKFLIREAMARELGLSESPNA